ncbi:hypothetical protein LMG33818_000525 [Halomonadaceae bacterium LMG 33818]|uniref:HlyU family transcriptional regulator n=1 Tax=Cernens ardua TaxID=3402176 RepID=UPI003EDC42A0
MLKKLFGLGRGKASSGKEKVIQGPTIEYKGFTIISTPEQVNGQFRVSGVIEWHDAEKGGEIYRFERSDTLPDREACIELTELKAQRFIDDMDGKIFDA